jgi:hypothetical protein
MQKSRTGQGAKDPWRRGRRPVGTRNGKEGRKPLARALFISVMAKRLEARRYSALTARLAITEIK